MYTEAIFGRECIEEVLIIKIDLGTITINIYLGAVLI